MAPRHSALGGGPSPLSAGWPVTLLELPGDAVENAPRLRLEGRLCLLRKVLGTMEAFAPLTHEERDKLLEAARLLDIPAHTLVSKQGSSRVSYGAPEGGCMYIVIEGSARIWRKAPNPGSRGAPPPPSQPPQGAAGTEETLGYVSSGDHFLASELLEPGVARGASVTTVRDTKCLLLDRRAFGGAFTRVKHTLLRELSHRRWLLENRGKVRMEDLHFGATIGKGARPTRSPRP